MVLLFARRDGIRSLPPWPHVTVYSAQAAHSIVAGDVLTGQQSRERFHILIVGRPEASIASAIERRAQRAASRARHGAQARLATRNDYAHVAAPLAFHAHAVRRKNRLRLGQQRSHHGKKLMLVDGTAPHFEVHANMLRVRSPGREGRDELGARIDDAPVLLDIGPVAQGLNSTRRRASTDRDKKAAFLAHLDDAARIVGSGDTALHESDIVRPFEGAAPRFGKIGEIHLSRELEQFVLGVQELQLAAIARGELEYRDARFHMFDIPNSCLTVRYENTGPSLQTKCSRYWQWPQSPTAHSIRRSIER